MTASVILPDRIDLGNVANLAGEIKARSGGDLVLDGGQVRHLGGLGLQLLLATAAHWRANGWRLDLAPRSDALVEALTLFGIAPDVFDQNNLMEHMI